MRYLLFLISFISFSTFSQDFKWEEEKIEVKTGEDQNVILSADAIISEGWSGFAQPNFWRNIMTLAPDSCIVNIAKTREVIDITSNIQWNKQTNDQKDVFRDSVRTAHGLTSEDRIFVTTGKKDFYKFDVVYPSLADGVAAFESNDVDPWYAQAILLIESPGQLKKSRAGAYGPFQLMPSVARAQGLTVNRYTDERSDFERSAFGSSNLIKTMCIPEAKRILNAHNLEFSENDIWFRLFVLHVYHAGAGNVSAVVNKIAPKEGGQQLIQTMWNTTAASFGNNSQNYSQLALASQLILHDIVHNESDSIQSCSSDSAMK
jgi:hypothetical protein